VYIAHALKKLAGKTHKNLIYPKKYK
jgi:hypothetical protein